MDGDASGIHGAAAVGSPAGLLRADGCHPSVGLQFGASGGNVAAGAACRATWLRKDESRAGPHPHRVLRRSGGGSCCYCTLFKF